MFQRIKSYLKRKLQGPTKVVKVTIPVYSTELLKGRRALITGGTSGIGFAIAAAFIRAGAEVTITGRDESRLDAAVSKLGGNAHALKLDISDPVQITGASSALVDFDILVNNAGYVGGGEFLSTQVEAYDKTLQTNLRGAYFLSQAIAQGWIAKEVKGNILNVCSASSLRPGQSPYILSKVALESLTRGMARKLVRHGIVVNGIAPGCTDTPQFCKGGNLVNARNPSGRLVTVEEVANLAVVLVSDMSRMVVGDVLYVTGGGAITTLDD